MNLKSIFVYLFVCSFVGEVAANSQLTSGWVSVQVPKMSCKACAAKIRKALKSDLSMTEVEVDVTAKTVSFSCPKETCSIDKVLTTLSGIGYTATVL